MKKLLKIKMNTKAELTSTEVVKIVFAALCIAILIYLAYNLYGLFIKKSDIAQAEASLENLYQKIGQVESGEKNNIVTIVESPKDWWVIAWPYGGGVEKPEACKKDYCVCICPYVFDVGEKEDSLEECNKKGVCRDVSKKITTGNSPLIIRQPISLNITLENNEILIKKIEK